MRLVEASQRLVNHSRLDLDNDDEVHVPLHVWSAFYLALAEEKKRDGDAVEPGLEALKKTIWGEHHPQPPQDIPSDLSYKTVDGESK